jgi:hypothetical protein
MSGRKHGSSVLIKRLDRLVGNASVDDDAAHTRFLQQIEHVRDHLSMVFHRFLGSGAEIKVNGLSLSPWDPFLSSHPATQRLPEERLPYENEYVEIAPFVLPHHSRLEMDEHRAAAGIRGWNLHQGFYVYRAKRLLVAGEWLGLPFQKEEHHKLARIRVDITNAMDLAWQIDVRKAVARIPRELRADFKRIADATRRRGSDAYRYRGRRIARAANVDRRFVWTSSVNRGTVGYHVDREHPLIAEALMAAGEGRPAAERALRIAEETLPVQAIMIDRRERPDDDREPFEGQTDEVDSMLRSALANMVDTGARPPEALALLARMEPFDAHPELIAALEEEHLDA